MEFLCIYGNESLFLSIHHSIRNVNLTEYADDTEREINGPSDSFCTQKYRNRFAMDYSWRQPALLLLRPFNPLQLSYPPIDTSWLEYLKQRPLYPRHLLYSIRYYVPFPPKPIQNQIKFNDDIHRNKAILNNLLTN